MSFGGMSVHLQMDLLGICPTGYGFLYAALLIARNKKRNAGLMQPASDKQAIPLSLSKEREVLCPSEPRFADGVHRHSR